jgi:hypothetical protein
MISFLTDNEMQHAVFHFRSPIPLSEKYNIEKEIIWEEEIEKAKKTGKKIWNGVVYTIEEMLQYDEETIHFVLSTCEYKDVLFRIVKDRSVIIRDYGISHLPKYITMDCIPVTKDGKFVFGIRGNSTLPDGGCIGLIGGTANMDEMEIGSGADLNKFMIREIEDETRLRVNENQLTLFSLNQFNAKYEFLYRLSLDLDSSEISRYHKEGEFVRLVCLTTEEIYNYADPTLDAFRYARLYIDRF